MLVITQTANAVMRFIGETVEPPSSRLAEADTRSVLEVASARPASRHSEGRSGGATRRRSFY
jgi:hypothetical protein